VRTVTLIVDHIKLTMRLEEDTASIPKLNCPSPPETHPSSSESSSRSATYSFAPNVAYTHENQATIAPNVVQHTVNIEPIVSVGEIQQVNTHLEPKACFETFKVRLSGADALAQEERDRVLVDSFQQCSPMSNPWVYNVMVLRHLLQLKWDPRSILKLHSTSDFAVLPIHSPETIDLLSCLETLSSQFPHCIEDIHRLYITLAEMAQEATRSHDSHQDTILLKLLRQLWHSAHSQSAQLEESALKLVSVVASKLRNRTSRRTLHSIASDFSTANHRITSLVGIPYELTSFVPAATQVLSCIPTVRLYELIPTITLGLSHKVASKNEALRAKTLGQMRVWLHVLHQLDSNPTLLNKSFVDAAIAPLADYAFAHQQHLHRRLPILLSALIIKAFQTTAFEEESMSKIHELLVSFSTTIQATSPPSIEATLGMLMSRLQAKGFPPEPLTGMVIDMFVQYTGLKAMPTLLQVLDRRRLTLMNAAPVHELVSKRVAAIQTQSNTTISEKALQHTAFDLQACEKTLEALSRVNPSTPEALKLEILTLQAQRQFQHILTRARAHHVLPLAYRNVPMSTEYTVNLIHQLAHQYTTDNTISQREAWRAMYYLYKYLQQYSLPMGPLLSKAVVRISIIRPMSENRFVSARRLIWVCHLVTRVEGEEVAKKIENSFWHWRGDLIQHAKNVYVGVGGHRADKAHVGTMKKLGLI
jgi:hypothetical protein